MRRNYRNHRSLLQYKLATSLSLCHTLRMGLQFKLLVIGVFLALALSFCEAKNATVKVVGLIHCTDCIKNQPSSSNASSSGLDVFIICKATKSEAKTEGNGAINKEGKFSVTLSAMTEDPSSIDGCYAKLQGKSGAPCPIQSNQTASVKIVSNFAPKRVMNRPTVIKFSPITCQSAIFWHFHNLTFFASPPPPPDYTPSPPPEDLDFPPLASPVQPPLPPPENSTPPPSTPVPSYDPPAPEFGAPSPPPELSSGSPPPAPEFEAPSPPPELSSGSPPPAPEFEAPSPPPELSFGSPPPAPPPTYQSPPSPTSQSPSPPPQAPPSRPQAPPVIDPIRTPTRPNPAKQSPPPTPALSGPPPQEKAIQPPPSAAISRPPSRRNPSPIPRAPPIPRLPLTPGAPRQYFNAPKSKSKPPRFT